MRSPLSIPPVSLKRADLYLACNHNKLPPLELLFHSASPGTTGCKTWQCSFQTQRRQPISNGHCTEQQEHSRNFSTSSLPFIYQIILDKRGRKCYAAVYNYVLRPLTCSLNITFRCLDGINALANARLSKCFSLKYSDPQAISAKTSSQAN